MPGQFVLELRPFGNHCNKGCIHCYQRKDYTEEILDLKILSKGLILLRDYLERFDFHRIKVVFHGGESLTDDGIWVQLAHSLVLSIFPSNRVCFLCHTHGFYPSSILTELMEKDIWCGISVVPPYVPPGIEFVHTARRLSSIQIVVTPDMPLDSLFYTMRVLPSNVNVKFIPCIGTTPESVCITPTEYASTMVEIYEYLADSKLWTRAFWEPISWCTFSPRTKVKFRGCRFTNACNLKNSKMVTIAIDSDGLVYSCNRFAGVQKYALSSLSETPNNWIEHARAEIELIKQTVYDSVTCMEVCRSCIAYKMQVCSGVGGCAFHGMLCEHSKVYDHYCEGERSILELTTKNHSLSTSLGYTDLVKY